MLSASCGKRISWVLVHDKARSDSGRRADRGTVRQGHSCPALWERDLDLRVTILTTKRVKDGPDFKGGITNFNKFSTDLRLLIQGAGGDALVTTVLDYYRLPPDFPGMDTRPASSDPIQRVEHVETALSEHFSYQHFVPFLSLHEFEAWLFSCPDTLPRVLAEPAGKQAFQGIRDSVQSPEQINDRPGHNPAARIVSIFPGYRKTIHGPTAIKKIGLDTIRLHCGHFNDWLLKLERFATTA